VGEKGEELGEFETVVVGVPAPQAADLLRAASNLRAKAASVHMNPCWSHALALFSRAELRELTLPLRTMGWVVFTLAVQGDRCGIR
jgi:predicted NAD/FAD-dependent oxidoreductase